MRKTKRHVALAGLILLAAASLAAQDFWVKKDWQHWSASECRKLLEDSPWARRRIISTSLMRELSRSTPVEGRVPEPEITYVAQLWSALPVRQAAVREVQLDPNFSKLPPADRKVHEQGHARVLATDFTNRIVVKVFFTTNVQQYLQDLSHFWRNRPADIWQQDTFLITDSGRIAPSEVRVAPEGGEFHLIFPRVVNGQPAVRPADKAFSLEFVHPTVGPLREQRVLLEFKVSEMTVDGQFFY